MELKIINSDRATSSKVKVGDIVYICTKPDYGCASQDSFYRGLNYISVTYDKNGSYPFFTIPEEDVVAIAQ